MSSALERANRRRTRDAVRRDVRPVRNCCVRTGCLQPRPGVSSSEERECTLHQQQGCGAACVTSHAATPEVTHATCCKTNQNRAIQKIGWACMPKALPFFV
eukprot:365482-Chlamydomonas_euryale.AAC.8